MSIEKIREQMKDRPRLWPSRQFYPSRTTPLLPLPGDYIRMLVELRDQGFNALEYGR